MGAAPCAVQGAGFPRRGGLTPPSATSSPRFNLSIQAHPPNPNASKPLQSSSILEF